MNTLAVLTGLTGALAQVVLIAAGSPILVGLMRQVRARLEGRAGAGILQPWRDLRKLLRKERLTSQGTSEVFRTAPLVLAATTLVVAAVVPFLTTNSPLDPAADLFAVVALLTLGTVATALAGIDTGTAFGGMGASREMTIVALVEPTLLVAILALSVPVGSTNLAAIVASTVNEPGRVVTPAAILAAGGFLLTAVLVLWRRDLVHIIRLFALQGAFLAGVVAIVAAHEGSVELSLLAVGILALRAVVLPIIVRRALRDGDNHSTRARETRPLVNVAVSLLTGAALTLLAYAVSTPLVGLAPGPAAQAIPTGITVVLIGFFVLVTRRRAVSQIVGFLLIDNGITVTAFLTTSGVPLVVELAVSLDVLFIVLVLQLLAGRIRSTFGDSDLDELKELRD